MQSLFNNYPFSAIVGQEVMKQALLLNVVNRKVGGVLIRGEKGTAKSTSVRALAELLPEINVVAGCPLGCDPSRPELLCTLCNQRLAQGEKLAGERRKIRVVDLPVGSTEDRVLGTLDLEKAIKRGEKHFEPGILAEAHRGILYVDEVNLLEDHIVDVLLDAAAMGVNSVEREGISFSHSTEFVLIGTMNPEEGELRPQLLDRFGLCVQVEGIADLEQRLEVVRRRGDFEDDQEAFRRTWQKADNDLRRRIAQAQGLLPEVDISEELQRFICRIAIAMKVDGHRADLVMLKAAKTLAALDGRREVVRQDIGQAAELALPHRMRRAPFEDFGLAPDKLAAVLAE